MTLLRTGAGQGTAGEQWLYQYNAGGQLASVTFSQPASGTGWTTVRSVQYAYYTGLLPNGSLDPNGNLGDLKTATIEDGSGATIDESYYRYYTPGSGMHCFFLLAGSPPPVYSTGLKFVFDSASFARLQAQFSNYDTATDAQVAPFAQHYFAYGNDNTRRCVHHDIQGAGGDTSYTDINVAGSVESIPTPGIGEFTYQYFSNGSYPTNLAAGSVAMANTWEFKTVETLPDGNSRNVVYTNYMGETMLEVFQDIADPTNSSLAGKQWGTFYTYDAQGRTLWTAQASAINLPVSLSTLEVNPDLMYLHNGDYAYLNNTAGEIDITDYYSATTATASAAGGVLGYVEDQRVDRGQSGTDVLLSSYNYFVHSYNSATRVEDASVTTYSYCGSAGYTTSYAYTWYKTPGNVETNQIYSCTTTLPAVAFDQNGSNVSTSTIDIYNQSGQVIWSRDADKYIAYTAYDPITGAVTKKVDDVDTNKSHPDFTGLAPWSTPAGGGLNLITQYQVDSLGRVIEEIDPDGLTTYTVYSENDGNCEMRVYSGWDSQSGCPAGATEIVRYNATYSYLETLTMSAVPTLDASGRPTGQESISNIQTLSRSYYNDANQLFENRQYFSLNGLTYSVLPNLGAAGGNYLASIYNYDATGRLQRTQSPDGTITQREYDSLGRLTCTWIGTDDTPASGTWSPLNNGGSSNMVKVASTIYDGNGVGDSNITQIIAYADANTSYTTNYNYDWRDRLTDVCGPDHVDAHTDYDNLNNVLETQTWANVTLDSSGNVVLPSGGLRAQQCFSYDPLGQVYSTETYSVNPEYGTLGDYLVDNSWYNGRGEIIKSADSSGLFHKTAYDGVGRDIADYTSFDPNELTTDYVSAGNVSDDTVVEETRYLYDKDGNVLATLDFQRLENDTTSRGALTAANSYATASINWYDLDDRLIDTVNYGHDSGGYVFNTDGSLKDANDNGIPDVAEGSAPALGSSVNYIVTSYAYDEAGRQYQTIDNMGRVTETVYDMLDRPVAVIANLVGSGTVTETTAGDTNQTTEYFYDSDGRLSTQRALDPKGLGKGVENEDTRYLYESPIEGSWVTSTIYPDSGDATSSGTDQVKTTYDRLGRQVTVTDQRGVVHAYAYDTAGRLQSDSVISLGRTGENVNGAVRRVDYGYDDVSRVATVATYSVVSGGTALSQIVYIYDGWGNVLQETQSHDGAHTPATIYTYDDGAVNGVAKYVRLSEITYPNGRIVYLNYGSNISNMLSRVDNIAASATPSNADKYVAYTYLGCSIIVEEDRPAVLGDLALSYGSGGNYSGLDGLGRVVQQNWTVGGVLIDGYGYTYDEDSNIHTRSNATASSLDESYSYDELDRLINTVRGGNAYQSWTLDSLSNWSTVTDSTGTQSRATDAANEIGAVTEPGTPGFSMVYDAAGNLQFDGKYHYTYDAWNHLVGVNADNSGSVGNLIASYAYDGQGTRIAKSSGGHTTDYYYDMNGHILEERVDGTAMTQYVWGCDNAPVCRLFDVNNNATFAQKLYYTTDAHGSITGMVDASTGQVVERYAYNSYGEVTFYARDWSEMVVTGHADGTASLYGNEVLYSGYRYDPETGDYQIGFRELDPSTGAWLQRDPAGYVDTMSVYAYVGSNPGRFVDPSGLITVGQVFTGIGQWGVHTVQGIGTGLAQTGMGAVDVATLTYGAAKWGITGDSSTLSNTTTYSQAAQPGYMPGWARTTEQTYNIAKAGGLSDAGAYALAGQEMLADAIGAKDFYDAYEGQDCVWLTKLTGPDRVERALNGTTKAAATAVMIDGALNGIAGGPRCFVAGTEILMADGAMDAVATTSTTNWNHTWLIIGGLVFVSGPIGWYVLRRKRKRSAEQGDEPIPEEPESQTLPLLEVFGGFVLIDYVT
jgi:RHS repeat-associated protein